MKKNTEYLVLLSFQLSLRYNDNYLISKELREWMMLQLQVKNSFVQMQTTIHFLLKFTEKIPVVFLQLFLIE